jgi:hypothetical protein
VTPPGPPQVVREKISRLTGTRIAVALVCDRDFTSEELGCFYRLASDSEPRPRDFQIESRIVRYECEADEAPKWRLAFEIFIVKSARPEQASPRPTSGIRHRTGMRRLHL